MKWQCRWANLIFGYDEFPPLKHYIEKIAASFWLDFHLIEKINLHLN